MSADDICLSGHAQFDQWDSDSFTTSYIYNFGISGITMLGIIMTF